MTAEKIDDLLAAQDWPNETARLLTDHARPGPWHYIDHNMSCVSESGAFVNRGTVLTKSIDCGGADSLDHADALFIAASRTLVPRLLDDCARLRAALRLAIEQRDLIHDSLHHVLNSKNENYQVGLDNMCQAHGSDQDDAAVLAALRGDRS